jgi:hypothetical protein
MKLNISKQKGASELLVLIVIIIISAIVLREVGAQGSAKIEEIKIKGSVDEIVILRNAIVRDSHNEYDFLHVTNAYVVSHNLAPDDWDYDVVNDRFVDANGLFITVANNIPSVFVPGTTGTSNDATVNDGFTISVFNLSPDNALTSVRSLANVFWGLRAKGGVQNNMIFKNADGNINLALLPDWLDSAYNATGGTVGLELITL